MGRLKLTLATAALLGLTLVLPAVVGADSLSPVTDLPWWLHDPGNPSGSWPQGCSWHCDCGNGPDNPKCGGVDFYLDAGTLVTAADHGRVWSSSPEWSWVDHGSVKTGYGHLSQTFWQMKEKYSEGLCRSTPIGWSGGSNGIDHLHFHGKTTKDNGQYKWTPIHGDQGGAPPADGSPHRYEEADFASGTWWQPREHYGGATNAYMVDDSARDTSPPEFFLYGNFGSGGWLFRRFGFSYWGRAHRHMWSRRVGGEPGYAASWQPNLPIADHNWAIWVFIPAKYATATNAHYQVQWWTGRQWESDDVRIDQNANYDEFVRLDGTRKTYPTLSPGRGQLRVFLMRDCDGCRLNADIAADAVLFVPGNCGP